MKQNELYKIDKDIKKLDNQNMENIFDIYSTDNGEYYYNLLKTVNFPENLNPNIYVEYITTPFDTWPGISWKFYEDVKLWWVICAVNNINNPTAQPKSGTVIKILGTEYIAEIMATIKGL